MLASAALIALVFEHRLDLIAQLGRILVPVRGNSMLHGRIQHFFFRSGDFQRAVLLTRIIPAIDRFS